MTASSYGNFNDIILFGKRCNIPVLCLSREDNLMMPVRKKMAADCDQGAEEDGYGSGRVRFQESCGSMVKSQLQTPTIEVNGIE